MKALAWPQTSPVVRNLIIASILFAAGGLLLITSPNQPPKTAQAQTGDYQATWQATHLLVARLMHPDLTTQQKCEAANTVNRAYGDPNDSETAIGPVRWEVKGVVDSTTKYKEVWSAATPPSTFTFGQGTWYTWFGNYGYCSNEKLKVVGNNNPQDWLLGFAQDMDLGRSAIEFRSIPVGEATTSINNLEPGNVRNLGKTTSCQWTNRCIYTTGPYAWTTFHEIDEARNDKHLNLGMLLPVRWNVTGLLCNLGDTRCD